MNKNQIMKADILDIVFENRNKVYGAYELRKYYYGRLKNALGLMFIVASTFAAMALLPKKSEHVIANPYEIPKTELAKAEMPPVEPEKKQELPKQETKTTPVNQASQVKHINNIAVVADNVKTDSIKTIAANDGIGRENIDVTTPGIIKVEPVKPETAGTGTVVKAEPKIDKTTPLNGDVVDVLPSFPGGMDALRKFLERNLHNPYDLENGSTVSVQVKFVVGYNGKLQSFTTVLDGGEEYNKEVVRVLKKMPDWEPGIAKGEKVSVYYTIPVKFVMSD